jgi:hypothetical protein
MPCAGRPLEPGRGARYALPVQRAQGASGIRLWYRSGTIAPWRQPGRRRAPRVRPGRAPCPLRTVPAALRQLQRPGPSGVERGACSLRHPGQPWRSRRLRRSRHSAARSLPFALCHLQRQRGAKGPAGGRGRHTPSFRARAPRRGDARRPRAKKLHRKLAYSNFIY